MNELEQIVKKLKAAEYEESVFSKIMHATSVQELLDANFDPKELLPLFYVAEELGRYEEEIESFPYAMAENLKRIQPMHTRRCLFI